MSSMEVWYSWKNPAGAAAKEKIHKNLSLPRSLLKQVRKQEEMQIATAVPLP